MLFSLHIPLFLALLTTGTVRGGERPWPPHDRLPPPEIVSLRGRVLVANPLVDQPVSYARLELFRAGKVVASAATDRQGYFKFIKGLPDGPYELVLEPGDYEGKVTVTITGKPPDVVLLARRRRA
ncbi:MAG TPA: carboxypeptidase-like regulatory domain-containing protein [Polyangia bacterium]|jgi:hypothetical protein|nr:carboxypeptidase-like regulatory domain-containing protein [Polyangia bacterium]